MFTTTQGYRRGDEAEVNDSREDSVFPVFDRL